jgi:serine/threonine-protein kinase
MSLASGTKLGRYEIRAKIGAGGMGEVYLAQDAKLDRKVALKLLPPDVAADHSRMNRFVQEAKAASALNHPNILTIYEIDETDLGHFIATEFIEGETVRECLRKAPLTITEGLNVAAQVAAALCAAHNAGIIHRDIKPENVMVRADGLVKVLDFGLAKLTATGASDSEDVTLTQPGMIMGTIAYMSPEQARGQVVDARTDVWSLGVLLYEMLSGRTPFGGETTSDTLVNILQREPDALNVRAVPDELARIIERMLAKKLEQRYPTMADAAGALKTLQRRIDFDSQMQQTALRNPGEARTEIFGAAAALKPVNDTASDSVRRTAGSSPSIAVLPFANLSPDPDNEYLCEGIAEELINALAKIDELKVSARTSAFSFKGKNANVSEIGERLGVKNILEGSIRKSGNRLRISVQLINAADGFHLWSERYDREMQDIFELQDEITLSVIDALKVKLLVNERGAVLKRYTDNAQAYELFLKGRYHHFKYSAEGWKRAIEFFEMAIEIEPSFAPAYAAMTTSWGCLWFFGLVSSAAAIAPMKEATAKALKLDEGLAEAYLSSAMVSFFYEWEWRKAEEEFRHALELNPSNPEALSFYSMFLALADRFDEAISQSKQSLAIDPLSPLINMNAGWTYFTGGLLDETMEQIRKMIQIEPGFWGAYWLQGAIYLLEGSYDKAVAELKRSVSLGGHQVVVADLASAYALAGRKEEAEAVLDQLLEKRKHEYVSAICIGRIYCRLGNTEKTIEWLEKAFAERNGEMLFLKAEVETAAKNDPLLDLANHPTVTALFQRMNLP